MVMKKGWTDFGGNKMLFPPEENRAEGREYKVNSRFVAAMRHFDDARAAAELKRNIEDVYADD